MSFSNNPKTEWVDNYEQRNMKLLAPLTYTDPWGQEWHVPEDSWLNGATIPRSLWSIVGSPFVGKHRRPSIIHDFFVGEGDNPDVTDQQRKEADDMFYNACLDEGMSKKDAGVFYLGVSIGRWLGRSRGFEKFNLDSLNTMHDDFYEIRKQQDEFISILQEADDLLDDGDFEALKSFAAEKTSE